MGVYFFFTRPPIADVQSAVLLVVVFYQCLNVDASRYDILSSDRVGHEYIWKNKIIITKHFILYKTVLHNLFTEWVVV